MKYRVRTIYDDDGMESVRDFKSLSEAKVFFANIAQDLIEYSVLEEITVNEMARKEGKK